MQTELNFDIPALLQLRKIANLEEWMCTPYKQGSVPRIPLFYTPSLGKAHFWTRPLSILERYSKNSVWSVFLFWLTVWSLWGFNPKTAEKYGHPNVNNSSVKRWMWTTYGVISWSIVEYLFHRFIFHSKTLIRIFPEFVFMLHFVHHKQPYDHSRLNMPVVVSAPVAIVLWKAVNSLFYSPQIWWWYWGLMLGYWSYEVAHFLTHSHYFRVDRKHHLLHHSLCSRKFGFTCVWWDKLFGTD